MTEFFLSICVMILNDLIKLDSAIKQIMCQAYHHVNYLVISMNFVASG